MAEEIYLTLVLQPAHPAPTLEAPLRGGMLLLDEEAKVVLALPALASQSAHQCADETSGLDVGAKRQILQPVRFHMARQGRTFKPVLLAAKIRRPSW